MSFLFYNELYFICAQISLPLIRKQPESKSFVGNNDRCSLRSLPHQAQVAQVVVEGNFFQLVKGEMWFKRAQDFFF